MNVSLNWLKDYIDLSDISERELVERLTLSTCEVEGVRKLNEHIQNTVVGEIVRIEHHPNADTLRVCDVRVDTGIGGRVSKIVCGGTNLRVGAKVVVALPGAAVRWHGQGEWVEMKELEIRGVKSVGMICAAEELGLPWLHTDADGSRPIMVLPDDAPVGESIDEYLGLDDTILDIDQKSITHRADLFSHVGLAGEIGAMFKREVKDERYQKYTLFREHLGYPSRDGRLASAVNQSGDASVTSGGVGIDVRIEDVGAVKRYSAFRIENVRVVPSPLWLQNRLRSIGVRSINNLVDATNYVMWEFGMPLHAFDVDKIAGHSKTIRFANRGERVVVLDGVEHELTETMLVAVDGDGHTIDLPGIMGGKASEVDHTTRIILLQAAVFDRIVIRKTSLALSRRTDASSLYERGIDPNLTLGALARAFEILKETCPDAVVSQQIDKYLEPSDPRELEFDPSMIQKQLGVELLSGEAKGILERLGFGVREAGGIWKITIPTRRKDIYGFQDICEEVGRVYGYDRIKPREHEAPLRVPVVPRVIQTRERFRDALVEVGFHEVITYIFWSLRDAKRLAIKPETLVVVQNPISEDLKYLRTSLLPGMLKAVVFNQGSVDTCSLFEVGTVFEFPRKESERCACLIGGSQSSETLFRKMIGVWEAVVRDLKLPNEYARVPVSESEALFSAHQWLSVRESVALVVEGTIVGVLGVVKQNVLDSYGVKRNVVFFELDADILAGLRESGWKYQKLPKFPSVLRDIALVADKQVAYADIFAILKAMEHLVNIELFDVYEGNELGAEKRSLAFHLEFSNPERTLKAEEVDEQLTKTLDQLETQLHVVLRNA